MQLWFYLHFPKLALEVLFRGHASGQPRLLVSTKGNKVLICNAVAESYGVKPEMSLNTACCLVPDVDVATSNPQLTQDRLKQLACYFYPLASHIQLSGADGILLEAGSMLSLFHGLESYQLQLRQKLAGLGLCFQMSSGHTPMVAGILARSGYGICSLSKQDHYARLHQLTVSDLGLDPGLVRRMNAMGIRSYTSLRRLPIKEIGYRFGRELLVFLQSLDECLEPTSPLELPRIFKIRMELNYELIYSKALLFPIKTVLQQLEAYLFARQIETDQLNLSLEHRSGADTLIPVRAAYGAWRCSDWLELLSIRMGQVKLTAPVMAFKLTCSAFNPWSIKGKDLLGYQDSATEGVRLVSVLIARLGEHKVCYPSASNDARPDIAGALVPILKSKAVEGGLIRPHPVFVTSVKYRVHVDSYELLEGPERVSSGWWHSQPFRGDLYLACSKHNALHWLARNDSGDWFNWGGYG